MELEGKVNWTGSEPQGLASITDTSISLTQEEKGVVIDELITLGKKVLESHNEVYKVFNNSDLGSIITRLEQNILQLQKIKDSL